MPLQHYFCLDIFQCLQHWRKNDVHDQQRQRPRRGWQAAAPVSLPLRSTFPNGTPKWWRKLYMTRPRRRENKHICWLILHGADPEGLTAPLGNCKPHLYYW